MFNSIVFISLLTFGVCGIIGVLVDLDHFVKYKGARNKRLFHKPLLILSIIAICGISAYLGRLLVG